MPRTPLILITLLILSSCGEDLRRVPHMEMPKPYPDTINADKVPQNDSQTPPQATSDRPVPVEKPSTTPVEDAAVKKAAKQVSDLEGQLAAARAILKSTTEERDDARREAELAPVRAAILWATLIGGAIGVVAALLAAATLLWSIPVGRSTLFCLSGGGFAVAALAQGFGMTLRYLPLIGVGFLVVAGIVGLVLIVRKAVIALRAAADHADRVENIDPNDQVAMLTAKLESATTQAKAGVHTIIDRVRSVGVKG